MPAPTTANATRAEDTATIAEKSKHISIKTLYNVFLFILFQHHLDHISTDDEIYDFPDLRR